MSRYILLERVNNPQISVDNPIINLLLQYGTHPSKGIIGQESLLDFLYKNNNQNLAEYLMYYEMRKVQR